MKLSVQDKARNNFKPMMVYGEKSLESVITRHTYSFGVFKDSKRTAKNFEYAEAIGLDFDGGLNIYKARSLFKNYKYIIAPTRNHRKVKNGVTDDRFRVILFLSKPITSPAIYKNTVKELLKAFPQADSACMDASRMFYPSNEVFSTKEYGQTIDPISHVEVVKPQYKVEKLTAKPENFTNCMWAIANGQFGEGESNNALLALVTHLKGLGYTKEMAYYFCKNALEKREATTGAGWDKDELWRTKIEYVYGDEFGNVKFNCQTEDTWLNEYCDNLDEPCKTKKSGFSVEKIGDFYKKKLEMDWLVKDMLMVGGCSLIAGPPKSGKSTIVRQLIKIMNEGGKFLDREVKPGRVLYLALEEYGGLLQKQMKQVGINDSSDVYLHNGKVDSEDKASDLEKVILELQPKLVVVDTLGHLFGVESLNNYSEVNDVFTKYREISRRTGAHILFVHHTNKGESLGQNSILGSTALSGATDCNIVFNRIGNERYISSNVRGGIPFHKTKLVFNEETQSYTISHGVEHDEF